MISLIATGAHNVVGLRAEGRITGEDYQRVAEELEARLKAHDKVRIYAEIEDITGATLDAFVQDLKLAVRHLRDVEREAVVSDKGWLEQLVKISDRLFPSIEVRHFGFDERDEALEWVRGE